MLPYLSTTRGYLTNFQLLLFEMYEFVFDNKMGNENADIQYHYDVLGIVSYLFAKSQMTYDILTARRSPMNIDVT